MRGPSSQGLSPHGTVPFTTSPKHQRGYLLVTVIITLFLVASIAVLLAHDSANSANTSNKELETARVDYVAAAGLQHALWRAQNNACMGDVTIPDNALGADSYSATITGAASGTLYSLSADQDAWIRSDQPTNNGGGDTRLHIKDSQVEQSLYRFDLSSLAAGAQINFAVASFYVSAEHPEGPVTVHRITTGWNEGDVTWDSISGSVDSGVLATIPAQPARDVRVQVNITGQVQAWVNGQPNNGILLASSAPGIHAQYASREDGANQPRLEVIVGSGPASPVTIQADGILATGNTRSLTRLDNRALQPSSMHVFQPDLIEGVDAYIWEAQKTTNKGTDDETWVSRTSNNASLSLLKFNMGAVPARAKILGATLSLHNRSGNNSNVPITAHRITNPWNEDFVTWNNRDSGTSWDTAGGDVDPTAIASTNVGPTRFIRYEWDITSLAQGWTDGAYANYGVALATAMASSVGERFDTSDHADPTRRPSLTITYACECGSPCMAPQASGNILMVVAEKTGLGQDDQLIKSLFEGWGYTIELISDSDNQNTFDGGFVRNDVVYVAESVDSTQLVSKVSAAPIGVINGDGWMNDELGFESGNSSNWPVGNSITVTDTSHYITAPLVAGSLTVYNADMGGLAIGNTPAPDLQSLADWGSDAGLAVLESGAMTAGGTPTAGRRVMLPFGRDPFMDWSLVNNSGHLIMQRALAWGMGADKTSSGSVLMVVDDSSNPIASELARQALIESMGFTVTLISDHASQGEFDTALATVDVAYIAGSGSPADVNTKLTAATIGVLSEDMGLVDELGIAQPSFLKRDSQSIDIFDNTHYVTSGFSLGTLQLYSYVPEIWTVTGLYAPGLQVLAGTEATSGSSFPLGLSLLEAGAELWGGGFAAGRRVQVPWAQGSFDITALNADGQTIMKRAIEWGMGAGPKFLPIAHWKLDDGTGLTAIDSEGGHDGTLTNDPVWTSGQVAGGLDFDGNDDYVDLGSNAELVDIFNGGATVTGWIYPRSWGESDNGRILDKASQISGDRDGWMIAVQGASPSVQFAQGFTGVRGFWRSQAGSVSLNEWVHFAVVYDGSSVANDAKIYLNGVEQSPLVEITPTGTIATDAGISMRMGNYAQDTSRTFDGIIDDVRIYERMLNDTEIAELAVPPSPLPIAHWKLDDGAGTIAIDSVGGHDGNLPNGGTWTTGQVDDALQFNGTNHYINVPHDDTLSLTTFTISAWMRPDTVSGFHAIMYKGASTAEANYHLYTDGDEISLGLTSGGWQYQIPTTSANLVAGQWYHLATTFDGASGEGKHYLDGSLIHTGTIGPAPVMNTGPLTIGTDPFDEDWVGILDDVRIYNSILDATEIAALAGSGSGGGGGGGGGGPGYTETYRPWSATSNDTWQSVDLAPFGVPANAVVEVAVINADTRKELWGGVRATGSTLDRRLQLHEAEDGGTDIMVMTVQADASSRIEHYADTASAVTFILLGYWGSGTFVESWDLIDAGASSTWRDLALNTYGVAPGSVAEILIHNRSMTTEVQAGVRSNGSSLDRRFEIHEPEGGGRDMVTLLVSADIDAGATVEIFMEHGGGDFNLMGQWSTPPGSYFEASVNLGSATSDSTWQTVDLTGYGVPANSVVQITLANQSTASENRQGVRAVGSTADRWISLHEAEGGGEDLATMHVRTDGSSQIQWYHEDVSDAHRFYLVGWWVPN